VKTAKGTNDNMGNGKENYIEQIKALYPMQFNEDIIFYLDSVERNHKNRQYNVELHDNYGYKYKTIHSRVLTRQKQNGTIARFFLGNLYTLDNINTFMRIHDIPYRLSYWDDSITALTNLDFKNIDDNTILSACWNDFQSQPDRYCRSNLNEFQSNSIARKMTKERAIEIIRKMQNDLGRPLLQSDFEGVKTTENTIGIRIIYRFWDNFQNMVNELDLLTHDTYFKPNSKYYRPHEEYLQLIETVCEYVKANGRNIILTEDFEKFGKDKKISINAIRNHCKLENTTLNEYVKYFGCELQKAGCGFNYTFEDGEHIESTYEYVFSNVLRECGFTYGKDYFRTVRYDSLDSEYKGNMNCDYKICFDNGSVLYVELAGILGNPEHIDCYKNNTVIKSKSKETYRLKLNQKREIFIRNNLEYLILLKPDMTEEKFKNILKKYVKDMAA
jgi:hypothetical protein